MPFLLFVFGPFVSGSLHSVSSFPLLPFIPPTFAPSLPSSFPSFPPTFFPFYLPSLPPFFLSSFLPFTS